MVTPSRIAFGKQKLDRAFDFDTARSHWFYKIFKLNHVQGLRSLKNQVLMESLDQRQKFFIKKIILR